MKKCLIIINTHKKESEKLGNRIKAFLKDYSIEVSFISFNGGDFNYHFDGFDFVITLGGDGTVLYACRGCLHLGIPVFPINLGEFGFIAGIQKDEWEENLVNFLEGKSKIEERTMILVNVIRDGKVVYTENALNDAVISAETVASTTLLDIASNNIPLGQFKADGVIVSTATGSTAYSVSAGGPIIDPELDALVLTPLNPFSLSARPLVFNPDSTLSIRMLPNRDKKAVLTVDGLPLVKLFEKDLVTVCKAEKKARLVGTTIEKFYNALRFKLNWAGGPHA